MHFIYALVDPRDGSIRYIGRCTDKAKRMGAHVAECKAGRGHNQKKRAWFAELMGDCVLPEMVEIGTADDDEQAMAAEEATIRDGLACGLALCNIKLTGAPASEKMRLRRLENKRRRQAQMAEMRAMDIRPGDVLEVVFRYVAIEPNRNYPAWEFKDARGMWCSFDMSQIKNSKLTRPAAKISAQALSDADERLDR